MMPDAMRTHSEVQISDSCNQCCCFQWRRKKTTESKAALQGSKITRQDTPMKVERNVTQIHLTSSQTEDVVFVQGYSVPADSALPEEAHTH